MVSSCAVPATHWCCLFRILSWEDFYPSPFIELNFIYSASPFSWVIVRKASSFFTVKPSQLLAACKSKLVYLKPSGVCAFMLMCNLNFFCSESSNSTIKLSNVHKFHGKLSFLSRNADINNVGDFMSQQPSFIVLVY